MRKVLILLFLCVGCGSYNDSRLSFYNYHIVKSNYPKYNIKEFKRFSYVFDVYNINDSIKVFVNSKGEIYKKIKLR